MAIEIREYADMSAPFDLAWRACLSGTVFYCTLKDLIDILRSANIVGQRDTGVSLAKSRNTRVFGQVGPIVEGEKQAADIEYGHIWLARRMGLPAHCSIELKATLDIEHT